MENKKKPSKIDLLESIPVPSVSFSEESESLKIKKPSSRIKNTSLGLQNNKLLRKWNKLNERILYKRKKNELQKFSYLNLIILVFLALPIISTFVKVIKVELAWLWYQTNIVVCKPSNLASNNNKQVGKSTSTSKIIKDFKNNIFLDVNTIWSPWVPRLSSEKSFCNDIDSLVFLWIWAFLWPVLIIIWLSFILFSFWSTWPSFKDYIKWQINVFIKILLPIILIALIFYFYYFRFPFLFGFSFVN